MEYKKARIITESAYKIVKKNFDYRLNMRRLEKIMKESIKKLKTINYVDFQILSYKAISMYKFVQIV